MAKHKRKATPEKKAAERAWDDADGLNDLVSEMVRDSMAKRESKEEWTRRLRALRDELDIHIEGAESSEKLP